MKMLHNYKNFLLHPITKFMDLNGKDSYSVYIPGIVVLLVALGGGF